MCETANRSRPRIVDMNETAEEYHQIWYDDPSSLRKKYAWAAAEGMLGVGMWVPSATLYDLETTKAMWAAVPGGS
eukprot:SAG31_NODE_2582_length_5436_cov_1.573356_10_plen_75_part_00